MDPRGDQGGTRRSPAHPGLAPLGAAKRLVAFKYVLLSSSFIVEEERAPGPNDSPEEPTADSPKEGDSAPAEVETTVDGGEGVGRFPLPRRDKGQIYAIANQLLGAGRIRVVCEDNVSRMGRITGRLKKKMWIREGDLLVVSPWTFQGDKADIMFRYTRTQASYLSRRKLLPQTVDLFGQAPEGPPAGTPPPAT